MITKYIEKKTLKTYQMEKNGALRPIMLMNELQSVADSHAESLGVGRTYCMEHNIAWVVTHYFIEIDELPTDTEEIQIMTWPSEHGALKAVRDFRIIGHDGRGMVRATSQWVLIDMATRRPLRLAEHMPSWEVIPERALDREFEKFPDFVADTEIKVAPRYDDIDVNRHVNNAVYAVWATESLGFDFRDAHKLLGLYINFKKEISADTREVMIESKLEDSKSRHMIKIGDTEHANVICEWK
jgi:acyl-ACP thioesterase